MPNQPSIVFSIRDNVKQTNYAIAENQVFAKVPTDLTLEADVPPEYRDQVAAARLTCDGIAYTDNARPWRLGTRFALTKGVHTFLATFLNSSGQMITTGTRNFVTQMASGGSTDPAPSPTIAKKGVCMYDSDSIKQCTPILTDLKITDLRFWVQAASYEKWTPTSSAKNCAAWTKAGFTPMPTVHISEIPKSLTIAKEFWKRVAGAFSGKVKAIQAINEVNLPGYFAGSLEQAFDLIAVPAAEAISAAGMTFVAPSISEHPEDFAEFASYGLVQLCQSCKGQIDLHSYGVNSTDQLIRMKPPLAIINNNVPVIQSEFNLHSGSKSGWAAEFPKAWAYARTRHERLYYYRLFPNKKTPAGGQSLLTVAGKKNQPYYDTYKGLN